MLAESEGPDQTACDCADAQSNLGIRCPRMLKDMFSHGAVQIDKKFNIVGWKMP